MAKETTEREVPESEITSQSSDQKPLVILVVVLFLVVLAGIYLFTSSRTRPTTPTQPSPTKTVPEATRMPSEVTPVTFSYERGTVAKLEGSTLSLQSDEGTSDFTVGEDAGIYGFVSPGSAESPPLSKKITLSELQVGDEVTLYWDENKVLKAIYVSYKE